MNGNRKLNPFKVMVDPRGFMRSFDARVKKSHWLIAGIVGFVWLFGKFYLYSLGYRFSVVALVIAALVLAIPVGLVIFNISGFLLHLTGKIFRGQGNFSDLYSAFAWSRVPEFFQMLSWIGLLFFFGGYSFTPILIAQEQLTLTVIALLSVQIICSIWKSIILFHTVGEVQGFSAWVAIWNVIFAWVILLCIDYGFNLIISAGLNYKIIAMQSFLHL